MTTYEKLQRRLRRTPRKWLVTGAAGFIGSHLSKYLVSKGIKVTIIDNFSTGKVSNLKSIRSKITLVNCDISDNSIDNYFQNVDVVFNCAAMVGVKLATSKPLEVLDQNISNVRKILNLCRKNNALHIFISSSEVYGPTRIKLSFLEIKTSRATLRISVGVI